MGSGHDHSHGGDAASNRGKLIIVFAITFAVMIAEIVGSALTGSLALLADAGHMFTDSAGLLIALIAASLALKPATLKRTWGYKRAEIVAAAGGMRGTLQLGQLGRQRGRRPSPQAAKHAADDGQDHRDNRELVRPCGRGSARAGHDNAGFLGSLLHFLDEPAGHPWVGAQALPPPPDAADPHNTPVLSPDLQGLEALPRQRGNRLLNAW